MRRKYLSIILMLAVAVLSSCGREDVPIEEPTGIIADITVVAPLSGFGDNGYNDEALSGIMETAGAQNLDVSVVRPSTLQEAEEYVEEWHHTNVSKRSMLILADSEYESLCRDLSPDGKKTVMQFESEGETQLEGVCTFRFSRFGASWLSGRMAQGSRAVHIVYDYSSNPRIQEAAAGFREGYLEGNPNGEVTVQSLASDFQGSSMPDSLYRLASRFSSDFFFPLASSSNAGLFKFSRESPFVLMLIAGMDVDCSLQSKRVPFSVVVNVKETVQDLVERWSRGEDITGHRNYSMADGAVNVVLSSSFYIINDIWEDYYTSPTYWEDLYDAYYEEALNQEMEYEKSRL